MADTSTSQKRRLSKAPRGHKSRKWTEAHPAADPKPDFALETYSATLLKEVMAARYAIPKNLKPLAGRYPWMFEASHLDLWMPDVWLSAFTELCYELNQVLGQDRHGFHWYKLVSVQGEPMWYWRFDDDTVMQMDSHLKRTQYSYTCQQPVSDPNSSLFQWIQKLVHNARQEALEDARAEATRVISNKPDKSGETGKATRRKP